MFWFSNDKKKENEHPYAEIIRHNVDAKQKLGITKEEIAKIKEFLYEEFVTNNEVYIDFYKVNANEIRVVKDNKSKEVCLDIPFFKINAFMKWLKDNKFFVREVVNGSKWEIFYDKI